MFLQSCLKPVQGFLQQCSVEYVIQEFMDTLQAQRASPMTPKVNLNQN